MNDGTKYQRLHTFVDGFIGANPRASVILDGSGYLYGTGYNGGSSLQGVVFRIAANPGDVNCDGVVNVADVLYLINYLFASGPLPCSGADANGDFAVNVADVLYLINYLFAAGPDPVN